MINVLLWWGMLTVQEVVPEGARRLWELSTFLLSFAMNPTLLLKVKFIN